MKGLLSATQIRCGRTVTVTVTHKAGKGSTHEGVSL